MINDLREQLAREHRWLLGPDAEHAADDALVVFVAFLRKQAEQLRSDGNKRSLRPATNTPEGWHATCWIQAKAFDAVADEIERTGEVCGYDHNSEAPFDDD